MSELKDKVLRDLGRLEFVTHESLLSRNTPDPAIRTAFANLYQAVLVPGRFIQECDIQDPDRQKEADLTEAKDSYSTAILKHQDVRQRGTIMSFDLHPYLTHPEATHVLFPDAKKNSFIEQADLQAITDIDRRLLQLSVKRSVVRVLCNLTVQEINELRLFTFSWVQDPVQQALFDRYRSVYEEMPCKNPLITDALEMYDLSETDTDKQASMRDFLAQFYEFAKK